MKLPVTIPTKFTFNTDKYHIINSEASARRFVGDILPRVKKAAADTETTGIDRYRDRIFTLQLHWGEKPAIIFQPYLHHLRKWLASKPTGIFFNAKYDMWMMENEGLPWLGEVQDTVVSDWLVDENVKNQTLKSRVSEVCGKPERPSWKKLFPRMNAPMAYEKAPHKFLEYSLADPVDTWDFGINRQKALEELEWTDGDSMWDYFREIECPTTRVLYNMERRGVEVDEEFLKEKEHEAKKELERLEALFYKVAGNDINMDSPQQLKKLFYEKMKCPVQYKMVKVPGGGKRKSVTTDANALQVLADKGVKVAQVLLEYREVNTLKKTFITGLLERVDEHSRLHTSYQQAFALTGRLSSRDPNLQNIPRAANDRFGIRTAFVASAGMLLGGADYNQIETRLAAHMSGDEDFIAACEASDVYASMGCKMFHVDMDYFKEDAKGNRSPDADEKRQRSKAITLGLFFGKQAKSIARDLKIEEEEAEDLFRVFFAGFPRLEKYMKQQIATCRKTGHVRTLLGRYRRIPDIRSQEFWKRSHAERQCLNSPIQGSALDIMKKAMLNIVASGILEEHHAHMILTVHDELIFEAPKDKIRLMMPKIAEMMANPFKTPLKVKLKAKPYIAQNWGEGK